MTVLIHNLRGAELARYKRENVVSRGDAVVEAKLHRLWFMDDAAVTATIRRAAIRDFERDMPPEVSRIGTIEI